MFCHGLQRNLVKRAIFSEKQVIWVLSNWIVQEVSQNTKFWLPRNLVCCKMNLGHGSITETFVRPFDHRDVEARLRVHQPRRSRCSLTDQPEVWRVQGSRPWDSQVPDSKIILLLTSPSSIWFVFIQLGRVSLGRVSSLETAVSLGLQIIQLRGASYL